MKTEATQQRVEITREQLKLAATSKEAWQEIYEQIKKGIEITWQEKK